eukprot:TRINITY_DN1464_c0_g1_i1.p2 TRINITY_DN1464_c0_g1~~TRINITY_DN1464_c0_g1_i1.p2  ORF type:complete len:68 (-),score=10.97 TRINITY_DN1464_c0_g1_i1:292-495(-)
MLGGFVDRLELELKELFPERLRDDLLIHAASWRNSAVWKGGALLSMNEQFQSQWYTKEAYDESRQHG